MKRELMRTVSSEWKRADLARRAASAPARAAGEPLRPAAPPSYPCCSTCGTALPGNGKCPNDGPDWPHQP